MLLTERKCEDVDYELYIKQLTKKNMESFFTVNFGGWSEDVSRDKFFNTLETGIVKLFFLDSVFIGYYSFVEEKNHSTSYILNDIHIEPEFQQKGFGSRLFTRLLLDLQTCNASQVKVFVFKNNPSCAFYIKHGFEIISFLEKSNTYVMIKTLSFD